MKGAFGTSLTNIDWGTRMVLRSHLAKKLKNKQKIRLFDLEGFQLIDLFNPYYIDRKTIYDFISYASRKYVAGGTLLDFGCGNKPYERLFSCDAYVGCDVTESGHFNKDKKADVFYDGHTLPFKSESFDTILATQVLEHVEHFDEVFKELIRVLKKGGIFIFTIPFASEEHEKPFDFRRFTSFGIKKLFANDGIELLELKRSTNYKNTIRFVRCMYNNNKYLQNKNLRDFVLRYLRCSMENLKFVLCRNNVTENDDLTINFFVIGRK